MLEDFLSYIESDLSINKDDFCLLAVSGGMDSMVMLHLFEQSAYSFQVAHVNHSTRNGGSDRDQFHISEYCKSRSIVFHSITLDYEELSNGNFQDNARNARYDFFHQIIDQEKIRYICTAHHKNDRWETFLMNLNRKSGIMGLTSLRAIQGKVIRPLMRFSRMQIEAYAEEYQVPYQHDISNDSDDYVRNAIRHNITPHIENLFPDIIENASSSITYLSDAEALLEEMIRCTDLIITNTKTKYVHIDMHQIMTYNNYKTLAFLILQKYGYTSSAVNDILNTKSTGAIFLSEQYEALYDRGELILRKKRKESSTVGLMIHLKVYDYGIYNLSDGRTIVVHPPNKKGDQINDHLKLAFIFSNDEPVTIRSLLPGDRYYPSHMDGKSKSVKKHLTNLKLNKWSKELVLAVESDDKIVHLIW